MSAYREAWRLAWPLILSNLSIPLLGVVDTAVVGHLPSPHYLGAVSLGAVTLDVTARQVVNSIKKNVTATAGITYTLTATAAAGVVPNSSRIVTLTLLTYP